MSTYALMIDGAVAAIYEDPAQEDVDALGLEPVTGVAPPRPSSGKHKLVLSGGELQWSDTRSLAERKADRWSAIKAERDIREYGGFAWGGSAFDSDPESQRRIQGAAQLAMLSQQLGQPFDITWTLADNSTRTLSGVDMLAVGVALSEHVGALHAAARTLRQQLDAASTAEQVEAVAWP